jgi:hypothetical protein
MGLLAAALTACSSNPYKHEILQTSDYTPNTARI